MSSHILAMNPLLSDMEDSVTLYARTPSRNAAPDKQANGVENERRVLYALLADRKYADLILDCQGIHIPVHKNIVCVQSTFFDMACSSGFKASA